MRSIEVAVPGGVGSGSFFTHLGSVLAGCSGFDVYVEVPRDHRRLAVLAGLPGRYRAKFRTGGVRADLYPDEAELADAVAAVVGTGVPFKATAGPHHAVRDTDPETGFEQHEVLNLLLATDSPLTGGPSRTRAHCSASGTARRSRNRYVAWTTGVRRAWSRVARGGWGPAYSHGLAGNIDFLLDAHHCTGDRCTARRPPVSSRC